MLALRELGLPLHEIAGWLDGDEDDPRRAVLRQLDRRDQPSADELIETMEVMMRAQDYYSPEQLAQLEERRKLLGEDAIRAAEQQWADLITEVRAHMERGTDPAEPAVQDLARRWNELIEAFTGGDPGIRKSLQKMYETEGAEAASHNMVDGDLMAYVGRINEAAGQ